MRTIYASIAAACLISVMPASADPPGVFPTPADSQFEIDDLGSNHYRIRVFINPNPEVVETDFRIEKSLEGSETIEIAATLEEDNPIRAVSLRVGQFSDRFANVSSITITNSSKSVGSLLVSRLYATTLGSISATTIAIARVTGDVQGPIHLDGTLFDVPFIQMMSDSGDLLGDLIMKGAGAQLSLMDFRNGSLGSVSDPISIEVDGDIYTIDAGELHANIRGAGGTGVFVNEIRNIRTFASGSTSGEFHGTIWAKKFRTASIIPWGMSLTGAFFGEVVLEQGFEQGSDHTTIDVPPAGMKGRFVIGAGLSGTWDAQFRLGVDPAWTVLRGTNYTPTGVYPDLSVSLGGGSIGLVPFHLHRTDCLPAHGAVVDPADATNKICMRHYGRVVWDLADGNPFQVHRRAIGSTSEADWQLQDCFTCELDSPVDEVVRVKTSSVEKFQRGFEYRVSLRTRSDGSNVLRCDLPHLTTAQDPEVFDYDPLIFQVCDTAAIGDADDTGCVNFADITNVLQHFGSVACLKYGDANRDGAVNFADITAVLQSFNSAPCGTCSGSSGLKVGDGFAAMDLDRGDAPTSLASAVMFITDALNLMGYASIDAFGDAIAQMDEEARNAEIRRLGEILDPE